jgi:hypothetical protein
MVALTDNGSHIAEGQGLELQKFKISTNEQ